MPVGKTLGHPREQHIQPGSEWCISIHGISKDIPGIAEDEVAQS